MNLKANSEAFTHLHLHTSKGSFLDGFCFPDALAEKAARTGARAVAVTDHGTLHGIHDFSKAMQSRGVTPIIGCEIYRTARLLAERGGDREKLSHLTLLASSEEGFANLSEMVSLASTEGFYYKPRVDDATLERFSPGLICLSGCMMGRLSQAILNDDGKAVSAEMDLLTGIFRERLFIEVHSHGIPEQVRLNNALRDLSRKHGIRLVAANDVHYLDKSDAPIHDGLLAIGTGSLISDAKRLKFGLDEFYYKTRSEMAAMFSGLEEALDGPDHVAEMCNFQMSYGRGLFPTVPGLSNEMASRVLREKAESSIGVLIQDSPVVRHRLDYEIGVIDKAGFSHYLLILSDICSFAKSKGIPLGPGRGSAVGSLVAYLTGITSVDPIKRGLLFERFLNPERISPPDIDTDVCSRRREEIIDYIRQKYGESQVVQIATYTSVGLKSGFRDACRAYNIPMSTVDSLTKLIPDGVALAPEDFLISDPRFKAAATKSGQDVVAACSLATALQGVTRNASVHPAGVVIAPHGSTLRRICPVFMSGKDGEQCIVVQADKETVEEIGLLKIDLLGLKNVTLVHDALALIKSSGVDLDLAAIPDDDPATANIYSSANAFGVFQVDSPTIRSFCVKMPVRSLTDFAIATSVCRPGPIDLIPDMLARFAGTVPPEPIHPSCEDITAESKGILIYQEQVMQVAQRLAGFSLAQADLLRRAMGKKKPEEMANVKKNFVDGCLATSGVEKSVAVKIFEGIEKFAGYGFNRSHAFAYATLSWQTAYLKAHHPVEFYAALLQSGKDVGHSLRDAQINGVSCRAPDVNSSMVDFCGVNGVLFAGLGCVKGLGASAKTIIEERESKGRFVDFSDFLGRCLPLGVRVNGILALAKAGAFDCFQNTTRSQILSLLEGVREQNIEPAKGTALKRLAIPFHEGLFSSERPELPQGRFYSENELFIKERESCGFAFSKNPLAAVLGMRPNVDSIPISKVQPSTKDVCIMGVVEDKELKRSKKTNNLYGTASVSDETGSISLRFFSRNNGGIPEFENLKKGGVYRIKGNTDDSGTILVRSVATVGPPEVVESLTVIFDKSVTSATLAELASYSSGNTGLPFLLEFNHNKRTVLKPDQSFQIPRTMPAFLRIMAMDGVADIRADLPS